MPQSRTDDVQRKRSPIDDDWVGEYVWISQSSALHKASLPTFHNLLSTHFWTSKIQCYHLVPITFIKYCSSQLRMCKEVKIHTMWQGGGCKIGDCDKLEYKAEPCDSKPSSGIRNCPNYQMIHAASSRKKGPRPGHSHSGQSTSSAAAR